MRVRRPASAAVRPAPRPSPESVAPPRALPDSGPRRGDAKTPPRQGRRRVARTPRLPGPEGPGGVSALAGLQPGVLLVQHVDAAAAAHHDAVLVPRLGGLQAVADLHLTGPWNAERQR